MKKNLIIAALLANCGQAIKLQQKHSMALNDQQDFDVKKQSQIAMQSFAQASKIGDNNDLKTSLQNIDFEEDDNVYQPPENIIAQQQIKRNQTREEMIADEMDQEEDAEGVVRVISRAQRMEEQTKAVEAENKRLESMSQSSMSQNYDLEHSYHSSHYEDKFQSQKNAFNEYLNYASGHAETYGKNLDDQTLDQKKSLQKKVQKAAQIEEQSEKKVQAKTETKVEQKLKSKIQAKSEVSQETQSENPEKIEKEQLPEKQVESALQQPEPYNPYVSNYEKESQEVQKMMEQSEDAKKLAEIEQNSSIIVDTPTQEVEQTNEYKSSNEKLIEKIADDQDNEKDIAQLIQKIRSPGELSQTKAAEINEAIKFQKDAVHSEVSEMEKGTYDELMIGGKHKENIQKPIQIKKEEKQQVKKVNDIKKVAEVKKVVEVQKIAEIKKVEDVKKVADNKSSGQDLAQLNELKEAKKKIEVIIASLEKK